MCCRDNHQFSNSPVGTGVPMRSFACIVVYNVVLGMVKVEVVHRIVLRLTQVTIEFDLVVGRPFIAELREKTERLL